MRAVDFFIIIFGTSLTSVYVHSKPAHNYSTLLLPNDMIRVKKRYEDSSTGYLEQCGIVTFPKAQEGVVNVLAFLDSSWPYSHRQAIMLKMLNERLRRSGLPDTLFFVVNVNPSSARTVDNAEDDIEREAWLGVSPDEIETFSDIVKTTDSLAMSMTPDIQLIQDNEDLEIWKQLRGSRDQVLIIDRCRKLTYQVIVPWSILHFPYVKAAILSTYKDEPCGPCDLIHDTRDPLKQRDEATPQKATLDSDLGSIPTTEEYFQNDRESHVPVTTESVLRSVLESSTTDTSQSGSTPNYLMSEVIDVTKDVTTAHNLIDDSDNYTTMVSGAEDREELTTLTSTTYIITGDLTKVEADTTTISSTLTNTDAADFINTVTSYPISDYKITSRNTTDKTFNSQTTPVFQFKEKSMVSQNTGSDLPDVEKKVVTTSSTNFINSDAMDSTDAASYYDTTATIYTKNEESLESHTTEFFKVQEKSTTLHNGDSTQSSVEKEDTTTSINSDTVDLDSVAVTGRVDDSATNQNVISVDTTTEETVDLTTSSISHVQEKSNEDNDSDSLQDRLNENSETEDTPPLSDMPLRIIMHAPHFHVDGDSTRMHEYLVLKTGSSDYHRHLSSYDATRLYRGPQDFHETPEYLRSQEIENKMWPMTNVIYNKDESPGLYGEVADYWKNSGSQENYEYTEETETPGVKQNTEEPNAGDRIWNKPSTTSNINLTGSGGIVNGESTLSDDGPDKTTGITERLQADFADESVTEKQEMNAETLNVEEEETRSKLIAHYSKLLPWIYYVLDK